jgi:fibrillarin-like pre-rRNA processing protein
VNVKPLPFAPERVIAVANKRFRQSIYQQTILALQFMQNTTMYGVFRQADKIFTKNPSSVRGHRVYNEKLYTYKGEEFRSWNPYRSKLAAGIKKKIIVNFSSDSHVLYLGAAMGTTLSHIADISLEGVVYAIEHTPLAMNKLLKVSMMRKNVIPILEDANHPDRYASLITPVDILYQDISQRNQANIFIRNIHRYLKSTGIGILMVKARSIDVSKKPDEAYKIVTKELKDAKIKIHSFTELLPYDKDHAMIVTSSTK